MLASRIVSSAIHPTQNALQIYHASQLSGTVFRKCHIRALLYYASRKDIDTRKGTYFGSVRRNYATTEDTTSVGLNRRQKKIEELYPDPVHTVSSIFQIVANELNIKNVFTVDSNKFAMSREIKWECTYNILWPESKTFVGSGQNKKVAAAKAAYKCLQWLEQEGKLRNKKPVLYTRREIQNIVNKPVKLSIPKKFLNEMEEAVEIFQHDIGNILANSKASSDRNLEFENNMSHLHRTHGMSQVNYEKLIERIKEKNVNGQRLPIFKFREEILDHINDKQVLLIKGDTGCGKTTQVPQFILDKYIEDHNIADCNIIVSQPRRISAMSLASRIAEERGENVGYTVGFQVRLQQVTPQLGCGILFCTTGILLRKLQFNPNLEGVSHVILDEAHERSVENDMLMVLLKRALRHNKSLKLIVMSATINPEVIQNYFQCPVVQVPGFLYPVKMHFLDEMRNMNISDHKVTKKTGQQIAVDHSGIKNLILWICKNKPPGAILCFLPGWSDIILVWNLLCISGTNAMILPIHSKLSHQEQQKIFDPVSDGTRKIILATDIAETGITVNDVVYVVDSAIKKQILWNEEKSVACIDFQWISQANIMQRKGRAGRVQPGESFHFISRDKYKNTEPYPRPEILCIDLEKTILDSKKYSDEKAREFFASMPEAPSENAIRVAVNNLINLNAIDYGEKLTALGKRMLYFTLHPRLSKAIIYSSIFKCTDAIVIIASQHSTDDNMFANMLGKNGALREKKKLYDQTSDHVAMLNIYNDWKKKATENNHSANTFCQNMEIIPGKLRALEKTYSVHIENLIESKMVSPEYMQNYYTKTLCNDFSSNNELIRAVLFSATNQLIRERKFSFRKGRFSTKRSELIDLNNANVCITQESVNYKREAGLHPFLTYIYSVHCNQRHMSLVRETSELSPLSVFLFSRGIVHYKKDSSTNVGNEDQVSILIDDRKILNFCSDVKTISVLLKIRSILWDVVDYILKHQGKYESDDQMDLEAVMQYKDDLLFIITDLLHETSNSVKSGEDSKQKAQTS